MEFSLNTIQTGFEFCIIGICLGFNNCFLTFLLLEELLACPDDYTRNRTAFFFCISFNLFPQLFRETYSQPFYNSRHLDHNLA